MTNTIEMHEELKQTVHTLLLERKRVKELEQQLALYEKNEIIDSRLHVSHVDEEHTALTQQNQILKEHFFQKDELAKALSLEVAELKKAIEEMIEPQQRQQQRIEKLVSVIKDKERTIAEYQQFEYSFKKTNEKKQALESALESERDSVEVYKKEFESLQKKLTESQSREAQLEKNVVNLHQKLDDMLDESAALKQELLSSQSLLNRHIERCHEISQKVDEQTQQLFAEQAEKEEVIEELTALQAQFASLKLKVSTSQQELAHFQSHYNGILAQIETLTTEKQQFQSTLDEKNQHLDSFKNELDLIKQMVANGLRETQELETRYLEAVNEKVAAISKTHQTQQHVDKQREEIRSLRDQLKESIILYNQTKEQSERNHQVSHEAHREEIYKLEEQLKLLHDQVAKETSSAEDLQKQLADALSFKNELADVTIQLKNALAERHVIENNLEELSGRIVSKEKVIEDFRQQIGALYLEKQQVEHSLTALQAHQEESDVRMRTAQQHLAKKVRETALLNERFEEHSHQLLELQAQLHESEAIIAHLHTQIELQQQQEKQLQEKLHIQIKTAETQIHKWEDKYFEMYDKWQITELTNRELKGLEEKYNKVQAMLANMGSLLGANAALAKPVEESEPRRGETVASQPVSAAYVAPLAMQAEVSHSATGHPATQPEALFSDQGLFDRPDPIVRYKQNLFD